MFASAMQPTKVSVTIKDDDHFAEIVDKILAGVNDEVTGKNIEELRKSVGSYLSKELDERSKDLNFTAK